MESQKERDDSRHYYINNQHPLIHDLLADETLSIVNDFQKIIKLIGETTPIEAIIQYHSEDPESHELRDKVKEPDKSEIELAKKMFNALTVSGMSKEMAIKQILNIEPFNHYTQLVEHF